MMEQSTIHSSIVKSVAGLLLMMLPVCGLYGQSFSVSGTMTDASTGEMLIGASVLVKGTTTGSITDVDGRYTIQVPGPEAVLIFSYVGMQTREQQVGTTRQLDVALESNSLDLNEVVVVGYGAQKRANLSGAVDNISLEQLESRPVGNLNQSLQGLVPNFNIDFPSGEPGSTANFNIRGFTSINGGSPLFVVDGVSYDANELNFLNPNDIASISILKDASSAAIYGARGAFGVVLITTKTGKETKVTYSNFLSVAQPTVLPDPITDPYVFLRLAELSTNNTPWDYNNYNDEEYTWARERSDNPAVEEVRLNPANPNAYIYMGDNNWNDYFFDDNSFSQSHNLSFSGAKDDFNYFVSGNFAEEDGLNKLATDQWNRYALRSKIGFSPKPWLTLENNTNVYQAGRERPTYALPDVYNLRPVDVAENPNGSWANTAAGRAAAQVVDGGQYDNSEYGFQSINRATVSLFEGMLSITGDATFRRNFAKTHQDSRQYVIGYGPDDLRTEGGEGFARENRTNERYNAYNLYLTISKTIAKHSFQVVTGYNQESYEYDFTSAQRQGLIVSNLPYIGVASGEQTVGTGFSDWAVQGVFGRVNYIFNNRYILEFNGRYDGTSRFPSADRWGFFPSFSAAWIVSEEPFMQSVANTVSTLKLRGSYGSLGNQSVGEYDYILNLPSGTTGYLIDGDYQRFIGAPGLNVDPNNYTWEEVETSNFGLDLGLFNDRIFTTFDYYVRNTNGMLAPGRELPDVLGTSEPEGNVADLQTKGWELSVALRNRFTLSNKALNVNVALTLADSRSEITRYPNEDLLFSGSYYPGQEIGEIWGLQSDGLFQNADEISQLDQSAIIPWGALSIVAGWPKFVDLDGNGAIEKGISANETRDYSVIGNSQPRYRYGIDLNMDWNGFDARVYFQGVGKRDYYPEHYLFWGLYQQPYANTYDHLLDFYRPNADSDAIRAQHSQAYLDMGLADANTDDPAYPILQAWLADYRVSNGLAIPQSNYLLDAAYVRLKNLTLGYTLPSDLTEKIGIGRFRLYVSGENLWESSDVAGFVDPEAVDGGTFNNGQFGGYAYPFQRRYSVGLNVEF